MQPLRLVSRLALAALGALCIWAGSATTASAQSLSQIAAMNMAFDQRQSAMLADMQRQNAMAQQRLWQQHLQANGPRLRYQYQQLLAAGHRSVTFEQFAYWDLMTAAGTNVQAGLAAQRAQFEGNQAAYRTVQQAHAGYNAAMAAASARQSAAIANYTNQAIRGVGPYADSQTGAQRMLPHHLSPGHVYRDGHDTYAQDAQGVYHRWTQQGWVRLDAVR